MESKFKILVVEDGATMRNRLCGILCDLGYSFRGNAGLEILAEIKSYQPQLVLMDTKLPEAPGYRICAELRKTDDGKRMGIIGMSSGDYGKEWREAGADAFLSKYDLQRTLESAVAKVLAKYDTSAGGP